MPTVKKIPATKARPRAVSVAPKTRRKVAAYARVSTDRDEQFTSYEAQIDYYTRFIRAREDWEFVGVYTDEGITGTNTRYREGFKRMIADALAGRIDLIVTKSVSRLARNTVDSLTTIRELKAHGTECYFEKENIWTFDEKGELLITIMSSLAQEESRSISENVTWGHRKRMADGKVSVPFSNFLGYRRGESGEMVIDEAQAKIVRDIYGWFLQGLTPHSIARRLTEQGVPSCCGGAKWYESTVRSILKNEKYKGDALMQKKYTKDFLTKRKVVNRGELPQYYVEGDHEAIIDPETFELVQREIARRKEGNLRYSGVDLFSSRIVCGQCGRYFGPKVWHSNTSYRKKIYRCHAKYGNGKSRDPAGQEGNSGGRKCDSPHLYEEEIRQAFLSALNRRIAACAEGGEFAFAGNAARAEKFDVRELERERDQLSGEVALFARQLEALAKENARLALDPQAYELRSAELEANYERAKSKYDAAVAEISERRAANANARRIAEALRGIREPVTEFDPELWAALLDHMTVYAKDDIRCTFRDGVEVKSGFIITRKGRSEREGEDSAAPKE